ncbi:MAG: thiol reductant ABC exporter subunit CydD [Oleiphilaceae bacterium]|nr:thiol reductant ABC exporter subunit CydD [Oleiphilaceae bacterium]
MKAITEPDSARGTPSGERQRSRRNRQWLRQWGRTVRPWLWLSVATGTLSGLATLAQMGLMAWLVHGVIVLDRPLSELHWPLLALVVAILLRSVGQGLQGISGARAAMAVRQGVRQALMARWSQQGPVHLAGQSPAVLAGEWVEQVEALEGYYARFQPQLWLSLILPLAVLALVFYLDWLAALFLLAAAPLIPLFMALVGMGAERLNRQHFTSVTRLAGHFLDRVRGLTTLQLFGQDRSAVKGVARASEHYRRLNMRTLRVAFLSSAVLEFFASVAIAVVAIYVGFGLLGYIQLGPAGELTLFSGLFVLLLAPEFFQPLRTLSQHYHDRAAALGAADHLLDRLQPSVSEPAPATDHRAPLPDRGPEDAVTVTDLVVRYPGRGRVFDPVSFQLPWGQSLVLTGPSGCGKSSLLHVLAGFYPAAEGRVSLFGAPPGRVPVAWMNQRPFLIQGTWADNLRLVQPRATEAAMEEALARAGLAQLLAAQPEGLDTPVGEGGQGLSGGQAHRLALARVFLAPVPLMLLDEPTAGLDPFTRNDVIEALKALPGQGITLIMASHQPELVAMADHQLWLGQNRQAPAPSLAGEAPHG